MKKQLLALWALGAASVGAAIDQNVQNDEPVMQPFTNLVSVAVGEGATGELRVML